MCAALSDNTMTHNSSVKNMKNEVTNFPGKARLDLSKLSKLGHLFKFMNNPPPKAPTAMWKSVLDNSFLTH